MNSNSFVKNFFFKNDANNNLTVNSIRVIAVFIALIFLLFTLYRYLAWFGDSSVFTFFCDFEFAVIAALPIAVVSLFYSKAKKGFSSFDESGVRKISVMVAVAVAILLILINMLLMQSEYLGAIVLAAVCGLAVYFIGNRILNVEMLPAGVARKTHYIAFIIGWIFAFFLPIAGIIIGIYIYTRKDNEYSKVHGAILVGAGMIIWILSFYALSLFGYYYV